MPPTSWGVLNAFPRVPTCRYHKVNLPIHEQARTRGTHFPVSRRTPGAGTLVGSVNDSRCTVHGLGPLQVNTNYYLKIKLYGTGANASVSNEVHVTTLSAAALFDDPAAGTMFLLGFTVYDAAGQVTARYDANGNGTFYTYDAAGQVTARYDANGNGTFYTYDAAGRQTKVTDALGNETTFAYDAAGRKTSETNALAATTTYAYDNASRLTT
ncbi:MAG: RHS repeat protein [Armatimonadetes bacterium]|nr:RHS repeat protein [Armatimonadota bacterium]